MALKLAPARSVRSQLVLALLASAVLAFAAAGGALLFYERLTLEDRAQAMAQPYTQLVSVGAEAAVAFADATRAQEILQTLRRDPQVLEASIVLADGRVLARYASPAAPAAPPPAARGGTEGGTGTKLAIGQGTARLSHALNDGARLLLTMDLSDLQRRTRDTLLVFAAGTVVLLGVMTLGLLLILQRTITDPISMLAQAVDRVRTRSGEVQPVPVAGADELARLGEAINAMMATIQDREAELCRLTTVQRTILDNVGSGIVSTSPDGVVTSFNPAAERLLGRAAAAVIGRPAPADWFDAGELSERARALTALLGEPVPAAFEALTALPRRDGTEERDWTFVRPDGTRVPVHLSMSAMRGEGGRITGFVGVAHDLTDRQHAEQALLRHKEELEATVEQRTAELRLARDAADAASRAKSAFLANMSHEIRTPMNAILGMSALALDSDLQPRQRNYISKAHAAAESLLVIINDILDFSKVEAGKIELEVTAFSLEDALAGVVDVLGPKAEQAGLALVLAPGPGLPRELVGDPGRLRQVLMNLCHNAIKFTPRGEVVLAVRELERTGTTSRLQFEVRDTGIGMSDEEQRRLFQPFSQADISTSRRYGGTGLGLAISQQLVQLMGGELCLESAAGAGSRFHFALEFPLPAVPSGPVPRTASVAPARSPAPPSWQDAHPVLEGARVLLVEDNPINQELAVELLSRAGVVVSVASDGREALALLQHEQFDAVLMDCQMPVMDGYATTQALRRQPPLKNLPVIAMTADAMVGQREAALAAGMNDHITKPIRVNDMLATLAHWVRPRAPQPAATEVEAEKDVQRARE
jgi:PAS domain S-box-containing protein